MKDKTKNEPRRESEHAALPGAELTGKPVPDRVLIAPWGRVESTNGTFVVDEESARLVAEAFEAHGTDLPVDYEHQTLGGRFSSPSGQAPAAGWIQSIECEPGVGLFANVSWTEAAREQLSGSQYRYLSPVAVVRTSDRKMIGLHSAALTNKPAIPGMHPIVNRTDAGAEALVALREQLALPESCADEELLSAASRRIAELEEAGRRRDAEERVAAAVGAGRLSEAQRACAVDLALLDGGLFDRWVQAAPVLVECGRTQPPADSAPLRGRGIEASARAEYRAHPELAALTSEKAYVADAIRDADGKR